MPSVTIVGSVNVDETLYVRTLPVRGETVLAESRTHGLGGKGANQALAARLLIDNVNLIASIGDDSAGEQARAKLFDSSVGLDHLAIHETFPTGSAHVVVDHSGENSIVVDTGANSGLSRGHVLRAISNLSPAVVLSQAEVPLGCILAAKEATEAIGARFILNLAPVTAGCCNESLLSAADPLVVNRVEAHAIVGGSDLQSPEDLITTLGKYSRSVILTLGAEGALVYNAHQLDFIKSVKVQRVVSTVGAGDAFCGVLAARLAQGDTLNEAARYASAAGALAVTSENAQIGYAAIPLGRTLKKLLSGELLEIKEGQS